MGATEPVPAPPAAMPAPAPVVVPPVPPPVPPPVLPAVLPAVVPLHNAANLLTALRLVLIPVFALFVVASEMRSTGWRVAAALAFGVASLTDFVDGWIARRYSLVTSFGKVADPIADKALTGTALVLLSGYGRVAWWVTALVLARELGVTALRFFVLRYGVIPASRGGKVKTALQILAIAWYVWPLPDPVAAAAPWIMAAAVVVTVATGLDYAVRALRMRRKD
jgi:CDP-diacylglycerol--glycerol-3-phosphate 3-phosphatidyltransferase